MRLRIVSPLLAVSVAIAPLVGCATIMHGTSQDVGLSSNPSAARITVDGRPLGTAPIVTKLSRKDNHILRMDLDGYSPYEATMTRGVSGWVWGNIVFGGIVGLAVDAISGGFYKLTPEQVMGQMAKQGASVQSTKDGLYITVVMTPDPAWQRIGTLERE
jgi:hypothetical protein